MLLAAGHLMEADVGRQGVGWLNEIPDVQDIVNWRTHQEEPKME
jgi:hypothetical protein